LSGLIISRLRGAKFVFEVRDLWPESLVGTGISDHTSLLYRSLLRLTTRLYRKSDHVVVVSPAFKKHIASHFDCAAGKISIVPNGVDVDWFEQAQALYIPERDDRFVVSFIGTIGNAHGVDVVLRAAQLLRDRHPNVIFRIIGDGAERAKIEASIQEQGLQNVEILPQQPRSKIPALIWNSDVCLVLLKRSEVFKTVIPTKMLEFMACGRPVMLAVEGQALEILEEAGAGIAIPPEDAEALASAVLTLQSNPSLALAYGRSGAIYIREKLSRRSTAFEYERVLMRLFGGEPSVSVETIEKAAGVS
jgi:glycosyltransferase involved in cell wall biosynthesis